MKKRTAYVILAVVCIVLSSFRKDCNNVDDGTSLKKDCPQKIIQVTNGQKWDLSPFYNFLEI
jgi:hypothetical protein